MVCQVSKVHYSAGSFFCWLSLGLVIWPRSGALFVSQNPREVCTFLQDGFQVVHIPLVRIVKFKFLAQFPVDHTFPTQSSLVLYSFCANLLIIWLIIFSLSRHNPHLLFYCILSIFAVIQFVLMALFCSVIRRDSVSFKVSLS